MAKEDKNKKPTTDSTEKKEQGWFSRLIDKIEKSLVVQYITTRPLLKGIVAVVIICLTTMGGCSLYDMAKDRTKKELEEKGVIKKEKHRRTLNN